ncbi:MAG: Hsp70 family protein [Planctomycetes bacterium]|nr:Hsp70 family protein [Planctomycetota bacterium]
MRDTMARPTRVTRLLLGLAITACAVGCGDASKPPAPTGPAPAVEIVAEAASPAIGQDGALVEAVGLETIGGVFSSMLPAGSALPCEASRLFSTGVDGQEQFAFTLYRGLGAKVQDNQLVGRFRVSGFPTGAPGVPQIEVRVSAVGRDLRIAATDTATAKACRVERVE